MSKLYSSDIDSQAELFGKYLTKRSPSKDIKERYISAIKNSNISIDEQDERIFTFIGRHPIFIGLIDAGLPFYRPYSEIRRRLYVMLAIVEATTEHVDMFLPVKRSPFYFIAFICTGARAVIKAILGSVIVRVVP